MARITREYQRLCVAEALRNLNKPDFLEESELVGWLDLQPSVSDYFARGSVLAAHLLSTTTLVTAKLGNFPRYQEHISLLKAVTNGVSITTWAKQHGHARETVSRTTWKQVTELVARELLSLKRAAG